jgi:CAAX prenyl protease-like protein
MSAPRATPTERAAAATVADAVAAEPTAPNALVARHPWLGYAGPFAVFMLLLAVADHVPLAQPWESVVRVGVIALAIWYFSRHLVASFRVPHWLGSIALGVGVFLLCIAPDALVPGWRDSALFQNSVTGHVKVSIPAAELANPLVLWLRVARAALLVPVLEELFWRGWLPRWLQDVDFRRVPLGRYSTFAFIVTALLFASEHGPYWEVGLLAGIAYNWWMWRTRSLGDLVLAHGVTHACLSGYVWATGQWQYWM